MERGKGNGEGITGTADGRLRKFPQSPPFFDASIRIGELNVQRRDDDKRASPSCRSQKWRMGSAAEERVTMRQTAQRSSRELSSTRATLNSTSSEMASRFRCNLDGRTRRSSSDRCCSTTELTGSRMGEVRQTMRMRFHVPFSHSMLPRFLPVSSPFAPCRCPSVVGYG